MASPGMDPVQIVQRINRLWQDGDVEAIGDYLDPDVVLVQPGFAGRAVGAEAVLQTFEEYVADATTLEFSESEHRADVFVDTAVVAYRFVATYEYKGARYEGAGRDVWVFERGDHGWRAVWRAMVDLEEAEIGEGDDGSDRLEAEG